MLQHLAQPFTHDSYASHPACLVNIGTVDVVRCAGARLSVSLSATSVNAAAAVADRRLRPAAAVVRLLRHRLPQRHCRLHRWVALCRQAGIALNPTFVTFTPWTTLEGFRELLAHIAEVGLIESVAPVSVRALWKDKAISCCGKRSRQSHYSRSSRPRIWLTGTLYLDAAIRGDGGHPCPAKHLHQLSLGRLRCACAVRALWSAAAPTDGARQAQSDTIESFSAKASHAV